ncbi:Rossmann-like and DUF2520 domain-containing protein [Glaciimonas immobilis]|uniref:Putative short-subunit dehydrogenase-like oxidoreductase (DUF2520 family) n=1 Tax=Glaciimonas immobilis TaxID=728004 RepID=A0A840RPJ4_9BURK|nr:Rossmann-like and DUF2520 domain-containing protein [Glaciimonas immobilis]KAF3999115.1 DUF2520 domain-containing protein [Glaciimonas immobilis]MBB5198551.1 putative short-subunit dehydrogenase-like oxidoreductase (DUF2520 family) [Glaciimonas immobilis]
MAGTAGSIGTVGELGQSNDGVDAGNADNAIETPTLARQTVSHDSAARNLTIIGCGKVGKTLGRLFNVHRTFQLLDVLNRSHDSARAACAFMGAGNAIANYAALRNADIYLLAVSDDQIIACCTALAATGKLSARSIVFHCSGALSSLALSSASAQGASVASIHPIRSFADPQAVAGDFAGTYCGSEGDAAALAMLIPAFDTIGAHCVTIARENKTVYHAAAVFASNYLVTLIDVARQAYMEAGLPAEIALRLIEPLLSESAANAFRLGPATALTGPIARGDMETVKRQYDAVQSWNPDVATLYHAFEGLTLKLAQQKK